MELKRNNISSGTEWERKVGYSRAVKVGNWIEVSGTTAVDENGEVIAENDAAAQSRFIFEKIRKTLEEAGSSLKDVIRTRIYVTDISNWIAVGEVHAEFFGDIKPAATMVEVSALIDPRLLVEIEVTAYSNK